MEFSTIILKKDGTEPLYRQIAGQIKEAVDRGELQEGSRLPPIRTIAALLKVSAITVTQAYEALAEAGITGGQVGRGTYILPGRGKIVVPARPFPPAESETNHPVNEARGESWQSELTNYLKPTRIGEVNRLITSARARWNGPDSEFISLSSGSPEPGLFPVTRFSQAMEEAGRNLEMENPLLFQYGPPLGDPETRKWLAGYLQKFGLNARPEEILLTTGSQQALDLIARVFLGPSEAVLVENPSYTAALDILEQRGVTWLPVPLDNEGLKVNLLSRLAERYHPKMLYCIPTAQSPTGVTLSLERRRQLVELAQRHNFLILEDDTCNEMFYEGETPPAIKSFDRDGHVIYIKSFSKLIFPATRLGCIVGPAFLIEKLAEAKLVFDRATSLPLARAILKHCDHHAFEKEMEEMRRVYRSRRTALLKGLEQELQGLDCNWTFPEAGFSLLLNLPPGINSLEVHQAAGAEGLGVSPGFLFSPTLQEKGQTLRLSFSDNPPERLEEATRRLGKTLRKLQGNRPTGMVPASFVATV